MLLHAKFSAESITSNVRLVSDGTFARHIINVVCVAGKEIQLAGVSRDIMLRTFI